MLKRYDYMDSDEFLMLKSQEGDDQAFGLLYDRYATKMVGYFYKMLWNDRNRAEDMTQDFFLWLIEKSLPPYGTTSFSVAFAPSAEGPAQRGAPHHQQ